jgi:hypothetical protein
MGKSGKRSGPVALFAAAILMLAQTAMAQEPPSPTDPIQSLTEGVDEITGGGTQGTSPPPSVPSQPSENDGSTGPEDPAPPDHAGGTVADVDLAGDDVATVNETDAQINDDGSSSGDVTLLAIGGNEVIGAHSTSGGQQSDSQASLGQLCAGSGGDVCLGLLFADTAASENSAEARGAVAAACVGGGQTEYSPDCAGLLGAGVATSDSEVTRDPATGQTSAEQETELADVCLGPEGESEGGVCSGLGITAIHSDSSSDAPSPTGAGANDRRSYVLAVETQGEQSLVVEDPTAVSIPPECPSGESLLCLFLNQGESFVFGGGAGGSQETLHVSILPGAVEGQDLLQVNLAGTESLARNPGPPAAAPAAPAGAEDLPGAVKGKGAEPGGPVAAPAGGTLAFTGADLLALVIALMVSLTAGLAAGLWERRRSLAG